MIKNPQFCKHIVQDVLRKLHFLYKLFGRREDSAKVPLTLVGGEHAQAELPQLMLSGYATLDVLQFYFRELYPVAATQPDED